MKKGFVFRRTVLSLAATRNPNKNKNRSQKLAILPFLRRQRSLANYAVSRFEFSPKSDWQSGWITRNFFRSQEINRTSSSENDTISCKVRRCDSNTGKFLKRLLKYFGSKTAWNFFPASTQVTIDIMCSVRLRGFQCKMTRYLFPAITVSGERVTRQVIRIDFSDTCCGLTVRLCALVTCGHFRA